VERRVRALKSGAATDHENLVAACFNHRPAGGYGEHGNQKSDESAHGFLQNANKERPYGVSTDSEAVAEAA
jgi:hypothetical protein